MVKKVNKFAEPNDKDQAKRKGRIDALMEERELAFSEEEKSVLRWKAPARAFKERNREYFTTVGAMVILVSVILMFAREFLLIAVILAFAFLVYVLASVKPEDVEHEVTTRGIRTGGKFFRWDVLGRYWFETRHGQKMVQVETAMAFPSRLLMLLGKEEEEKMQGILSKYLLNETPEPTVLDKSADWLTEKIPLDAS